MSFEPKTVIEWYKAKPKWLKVIFFVFLVFGVVLAAIWWVLTRSTSLRLSSKSEPLQTVIDALEDKYRKNVEKAIRVIERNDEKIKKLKDQRAKLEKKRVDGMKQNENEHEAIDSASDADSVVNAINANRRRRRSTDAD